MKRSRLKGRVSNELTRAQTEMQRWQTQYDDAMRALHGMGYRAKFQSVVEPRVFRPV